MPFNKEEVVFCPQCGAEWSADTDKCRLCDSLIWPNNNVRNVEGRKDDQGKLRYDLIPAWPLKQLAAVMTFGAQKYGDHNWLRGMPCSKVYAAAQRHMNAFWEGEDTDKESGLPHMAHAAVGCLFLMEYDFREYEEFDDRMHSVYSLDDIREILDRRANERTG